MLTQAEIELIIERNRQWLGAATPQTPPPSLLEPERTSEAVALIIANAVCAALIVLLVLGAAYLPRSERPASTRTTEPTVVPAHPAAETYRGQGMGAVSSASNANIAAWMCLTGHA